MASIVRVFIAAHGHLSFYEKIQEALEEASSVDMPIHVENWHHAIMAKSERMEYSGVIFTTEDLTNNEDTETISSFFRGLIPSLLKVESTLRSHSILIIHNSEHVLASAMCELFNLDVEQWLKFTPEHAFHYFSPTRNFIPARHTKSLREFYSRIQ